jgi:hypothetical protein
MARVRVFGFHRSDRLRRFSVRGFLPLLVVVLTVILGIVGQGTTTASAASFAYDVPTIARVEVQEIGGIEARSAQPSRPRRWIAIGGPFPTVGAAVIAGGTLVAAQAADTSGIESPSAA